MSNKPRIRSLILASFLVVLWAAGYLPGLGSQTASEILAKKVEKFIGKYALVLKGETTILDFSVREGAFWVDSGDGRPVIIEPVQEAPDKFACDDIKNGHFQFEFLKDETGAYTKCHIVAADLGLDAVAEKIKG